MLDFDLPRMVRGSPPTARNIPEAGTSAWQRRMNGNTTQRLVGGVFFAMALFAWPAPARADMVKLAWLPVGEFAPKDRRAETDIYVVEREASAGWEQVAVVRHARTDSHWDERSGVFRLEVQVDGAPGRLRLFAVDMVGNFSQPEAIEPAAPAPPPSCTWEVAGYRVPVRCERACVCDVVLKRLADAREELRSAGVMEKPELLDQALSRPTTIEIVGPERLTMPSGQHAAGAAREGWMLIASDMRSAAHELFHLYQIATGHQPDLAHQHDAWERDPRLRAIDTKHGIGGWHR